MKIENEAVRQVYALCREMYRGRITRGDLMTKVEEQQLMAVGSAGNYAQNFKYMMQGVGYNRAMNLYSTDYFLRNIRNDYGQLSFEKALHAANEHVKYYDSLGKGRQVSTRKLLKKLDKEFQSESFWYPDEIPDDEGTDHREGKAKQVLVNVYERNSKARLECIDEYGYVCAVCSFNFESFYGTLGSGFIHVHHLVDIATTDQEYTVDPIKDLRPVCPNCHAMLHKEKPAMSIEKLKSIIAEQN